MRRITARQGLLLAAWLVTGACAVQQPPWVSQLGYRGDEVFTARRGHLGMPFVEVTIGESKWRCLFDTGSSRTNIDPQLVRDLGLPVAANGVRIDSLDIGTLVFAVPSAKVVPKSGIDPTLTPPIRLSVGSDILAQVILTVDYAEGQLLLRDARR